MPKKLSQLTAELIELSGKIITIYGCESCEVLNSAEGLEKVVVIEKWRSIEDHQAAARSISPHDFQKIVGFLKGKPTGRYYKQTEY